MTQRAAGGNVRVHTFYAKIDPRQFGQMREIQSASDGRSIPIRDRAELVLGKRIPIKCHPITKFWQTVGPIYTGTTVARILQTARQSIANRKQTAPERGKRQRHARATLDSGGGKSKFEISRGLETESF